MRVTKWAPLVLTLLMALVELGQPLRTGAPALACINLRPLHGLHRSKPASASQFFVSQSSLNYEPSQNITVDIMTHSSERYFRGFMIQAYNPASGAQIGHFVSSDTVRPLSSCSAATHRNNLNKGHVTLTWIPPAHSSNHELPFNSSPANQWLGIRQPHQPHLNMGINKRQLPNAEATPSAQAATVPVAAPAATSVVAGPTVNNNQSSTLAEFDPAPVAHVIPVHQVRFRASVVVTYEEFYVGFESSEQSFAKFDFAKKAT